MATPLSSIGALGGTTEQDIFKQFYPKYPQPAALALTPQNTAQAPSVQAAADAVNQAASYANQQLGGGATPAAPKSAAEEYGWTAESTPLSYGKWSGGGGLSGIAYNPETSRFLSSSSISTGSDQSNQARQAIDAHNKALDEYQLSLPGVADQRAAAAAEKAAQQAYNLEHRYDYLLPRVTDFGGQYYTNYLSGATGLRPEELTSLINEYSMQQYGVPASEVSTGTQAMGLYGRGQELIGEQKKRQIADQIRSRYGDQYNFTDDQINDMVGTIFENQSQGIGSWEYVPSMGGLIFWDPLMPNRNSFGMNISK